MVEEKKEPEDIFAEVEKDSEPKEAEKTAEEIPEKRAILSENVSLPRKQFSRMILATFIIIVIFALAFVAVFFYARSKITRKNNRIINQKRRYSA